MPRFSSFLALVIVGLALVREDAAIENKAAKTWTSRTLSIEPKPVRDSSSPTPSRPSIPSEPTSKLRTKAESHRVPGEYIVVLKPEYKVKSFMDSHSAEVQSSGSDSLVQLVFTTVVNGFSARLSPESLQKFLEMDEVSYIEENSIVRVQYSWGIDRVNQRSLPLDVDTVFAGDGNGVNVYILDSGINPNNTYFGGRAVVGSDTVGGQDGIDCDGHGTHVAGTIGADSFGIARAATLYAVRVLDCNGDGTLTGVLEGLDWVRNNVRKPAIVSMSLGGTASDVMDAAVNDVYNDGVTVVAAAGNDGVNACYFSPGRNPNVLTVAATASNDYEPAFSNFGDCVDLYAPGVYITSTWYTSDNATATISGTSMSCPHVTGAAAIILGEHNSYSPRQVMNKILRDATRDVIPNAYSINRLLYTPRNSTEGYTTIEVTEGLTTRGVQDTVGYTTHGQSSRLKGTPVLFFPLCLMVLIVTMREYQ
ncbi:extracellular serine proteinase-like [Diadema antillarum]|uniref:extracellular serine proteinase-like n=1 Tax=Diadema antillarum TaxID=105358 RepID=UPI003A884535